MKVDLKNRLTKEQLDALKNSPNVVRLDYLAKVVRSGTVTLEEDAEWKEKTDWVSRLPRNVLSESHRPPCFV